jgi:WD40 repeat protein
MRILDGGKKKREFTGVAFDPTGTLVVAGCDWGHRDPTAVWEVATGTLRGWYDSLGHKPESLRFHPLTGHLLVPTDSGLKVYDTTTHDLVRVFASGPHPGASAFDPSGDWYVCVNHPDGRQSFLSAYRWSSVADETLLWRVPILDTPDELGYIDHLACLGDGKRFVSAEHNLRRNIRDGRSWVAIRSRSDGRLLQSANGIFGHGDRLFASPYTDAIVVMKPKSLRVHPINDLDTPPRVLKNDTKHNFTGVAFHPSGRYLAATSNDETVKLYDTTTWEVARTFTWDIGRMRSIAFSPDGTLAAAGSDKGKVVVWDVDV